MRERRGGGGESLCAFLTGAEYNRKRKSQRRSRIKRSRGKRRDEGKEKRVSRREEDRERARKRTETNGEACLVRLVLATLLSQVQRHASPSS